MEVEESGENGKEMEVERRGNGKIKINLNAKGPKIKWETA